MIRINEANLNNLADKLIEIIKKRTNVFKTITVVVPNSKMQQWFKSYWLRTQSDILMNVKFENINETLLSLIDCNERFALISSDELKSLVIKNILAKENELDLPDTIKNYIYDNGEINSIKLYDLSSKLTQLFNEYEKDYFNFTGWQRKLYKFVTVEAKENKLVTLANVYNSSFKKVKSLSDTLYFFGFNSFTKLQEEILSNYEESDSIVMLNLTKIDEYTNSFTITKAPSKLREIESLHSKICQLIKDENAKYSEFLVLAPEISGYENAINRVFKQDNINFPNIPYVINDRKKIDTNVSLGLSKLFEIVNKKYYTRLDLYSLLTNKDIQVCRNISEDDVRNFSESVVAMNAYRNGDDRFDWEYVKKRLVLSKVSGINDVNNNIIELSDGKYIPFSNIGFDDEAIVKFVSIIDDLTSWVKTIESIDYISEEGLTLLLGELDKWFSIKDTNGFETNSYYKSIIRLIYTWIKTVKTNNLVPLQTFVYLLLDVSKTTKFKVGEFFVKGVTFADFDPNSILSTKYVFFLNAGSKELPKNVFKSELDLRGYDISNKALLENSFYLQYQNSQKFYVSYIGLNLKTDEELYLSTFVHNLKGKVNNVIAEEEISIDETRSWDELFTKKSFKDRNYYFGLMNRNEEEDLPASYNFASERRKKIKVKEMSDFLDEPLKFKITSLFSKEDTLSEEIKEEYEPFGVDNLTKDGLIKSICLDLLEKSKEVNIESLLGKFNLNHKLPDITDEINKASLEEILFECNKLVAYIKEETNDNYELITLDDLSFTDITVVDQEQKKTEWSLTCRDKVCRYVNGKERLYIQIKKIPNKDSIRDYLFIYVFSLMDVANLPDDEYRILLSRGTEKVEKISMEYKITPQEAKDILSKIYVLMHDYSDNVCFPINFMLDKNIASLNAFINKLSSSWQYFSDSILIDYDTQLGYTEENFITKYHEKMKEVISLVKFLQRTEGEDSNE